MYSHYFAFWKVSVILSISFLYFLIASVCYSIPICKTMEDFWCTYHLVIPSFSEFTEKGYPKTCSILQYAGDIEWKWDRGKTRDVYFAYNFAPPKTVVVHEEYLIYDTIGLIGSVGGTLGMFIGFSFSGTISQIITYLSMLRSRLFD